MALIETDGIVLRSYALSDADRIAVILTRDHGVIRGVAKGAKRLKSKFGSALEPLSEVRVSFTSKENSELVYIEGVDLINSHFGLASEPETSRHLAHFVEMILAVSPPGDPNELLYRMVKAATDTVQSDVSGVRAVRFYFDVWLLRISGYLPDWDRCSVCSQMLSSGELGYFEDNLRVRCERCDHSGRRHSLLSGNDRELVAAIKRVSPRQFVDLKMLPASDGLLSAIEKLTAIATGRETASNRQG